jgi:ankyrin repeat protein
MSRFGSSDHAKGGNFTEQLLYVQHVHKENYLTIRIFSEQSIWEYFLKDSQIFSDSRFAEYLRNPKENLDILNIMHSLQDEIVKVAMVCTNPLPIPLKTAVTIHAFVVLKTQNLKTKNVMWYSMEKNGQYIVLQQSPNIVDVMYKLYDHEEQKLVKRLGPVKRESFARGNGKELEYLIRAIWKTNQVSTKYNLLFSNCQNFAEFVIEKACFRGNKWSTWISSIVDRIGLSNKKSQTEIEADTLKYNGRKDAKFAYYKFMAEGRRQDFEELVGNLTSESLNSVDSQGYTLLEWATVFSTSHWPIDKFLREKGAKIQTDDEGLFRRNVFFIALQYLPSKKESRYLSFDGINIHGVNQTGDTALHLALYGEKWDVAEKILDQFPDYDVDDTNSKGCTPLHVAVHPKCKMDLIKKILARMNSESVNAQDERGWTALHDAIDNQSEIAVKEMLKRDDVDVNLKNNNNVTALHFACLWKNIPIDLFRIILEKSTDVNAQDDEYGYTVLHGAIMSKSKNVVEELLKRKDVDVNLKRNDNQTTLHQASWWKDIPRNLFTKILEKSTDVNVQDKGGNTTLQSAIKGENRTAVEELLKRMNVNVNLKNNKNKTALHRASCWKDIPIDLFRVILEISTDVNVQDVRGNTALHWAIYNESKTAVEELLKRDDVDVNLKNNYNKTALYFATKWKNMPIKLFTKILEKTDDGIAEDILRLHWDILCESKKTAIRKRRERKDLDVNQMNYNNISFFFLPLFVLFSLLLIHFIFVYSG